MKAMILAAGRGERLRPLTDNIPKPLVRVNGRPIIEYTINALEVAGFKDLVVNLAHLGDKIEMGLGDGNRFKVNISYSREGMVGLETGGGIFRALPLLGTDPFVVVNGDIFCDFAYQILAGKPRGLAHIILVPNPDHNPCGDFSLTDDGAVYEGGNQSYTFSGIGIYRPELFEGCKDGKFPLAPILQQAIKRGEVSGEVYRGLWMDLGTLERLHALEKILVERPTDFLRYKT